MGNDKTARTPGAWHLEYRDHKANAFGDVLLAFVRPGSARCFYIHKADAPHLVTACNAYADLLAQRDALAQALRDLMNWSSYAGVRTAIKRATCTKAEGFDRSLDKARAALASVKGGDRESKLRELAQEAAGILWRRVPEGDLDEDTKDLIELWRRKYRKALNEAGL